MPILPGLARMVDEAQLAFSFRYEVWDENALVMLGHFGTSPGQHLWVRSSNTLVLDEQMTFGPQTQTLPTVNVLKLYTRKGPSGAWELLDRVPIGPVNVPAGVVLRVTRITLNYQTLS